MAPALEKNADEWHLENPDKKIVVLIGKAKTRQPKTQNQSRYMRTRWTPKVGNRFSVSSNVEDYQPGKIYVVSRVDPTDNTLKGTEDGSGRELLWVAWDRVRLITSEIGWDWLKTQLPDDVLEILSAFDGLDQLTLKTHIRDQIVRSTPNLLQRILISKMEIDNGGKAAPEGNGLSDDDDCLDI